MIGSSQEYLDLNTDYTVSVFYEHLKSSSTMRPSPRGSIPT